MRWVPCVVRSWSATGELSVAVGHPLVDGYLEFCRARCRPNTILAIAWDLKTFFVTVGRAPTRVTSGDVLSFIRAQSSPGGTVVRLDGSSGMSARTIRRRCRRCRGSTPMWWRGVTRR